jgi:hypothetical protein
MGVVVVYSGLGLGQRWKVQGNEKSSARKPLTVFTNLVDVFVISLHLPAYTAYNTTPVHGAHAFTGPILLIAYSVLPPV